MIIAQRVTLTQTPSGDLVYRRLRSARAVITTILGLLSLLLAACGSGSDSDTDTDKPPPSSEPNLPGLHLFMDEVDLALLYARDPLSNDRLPAQARFEPDGSEVTLRGLRFRGASSRLLPKKSFNIRFEEEQPLLFGSSRMNANAMYTDAAMMREHLAWSLFQQLGHPASRTRYFDLWINDIFEGLYLHIERVDGDLLANAGLNPDGTLVRDQFRREQGDRDSVFGFALSAIPEDERVAFIAGSFDSRGDPDWDRLVELVLWVEQAASGAAFAQGFEERFDVEVFIDWLAVHYLIGDIDSFGDDYWLYLDHDDDSARWIVIPWDKDLSFGSHDRLDYGTANDFFSYEYPLRGGWQNQLIDLFLDTPSLRQGLKERLVKLMDEVFDLSYFAALIEATSQQISPSVARQPGADAFALHPGNHHSVPGVAHLHNATLLDFIELRHAFVKRAINPVGGQAYVARMDLTDATVGDTLLFTDQQGWTIGKLRLLSAPEIAGTVRIEVSEDPTMNGIDRVWRLNSSAAQFHADLSLYYRNDTAADAFSTANWYSGGEAAVGNQWKLQMARKFGLDFEPLADSRVNPFSNKVSAPVNIDFGSGQEFVIRYRD